MARSRRLTRRPRPWGPSLPRGRVGRDLVSEADGGAHSVAAHRDVLARVGAHVLAEHLDGVEHREAEAPLVLRQAVLERAAEAVRVAVAPAKRPALEADPQFEARRRVGPHGRLPPLAGRTEEQAQRQVEAVAPTEQVEPGRGAADPLALDQRAGLRREERAAIALQPEGGPAGEVVGIGLEAGFGRQVGAVMGKKAFYRMDTLLEPDERGWVNLPLAMGRLPVRVLELRLMKLKCWMTQHQRQYQLQNSVLCQIIKTNLEYCFY